MFKKLTEQSSRDHTRTIYVNMDRVEKVYTVPTGTRICIGTSMTDVLEAIEDVLELPKLMTLDNIFTEEEDKALVRSRNENGRVSNPAIKPDR